MTHTDRQTDRQTDALMTAQYNVSNRSTRQTDRVRRASILAARSVDWANERADGYWVV